MHSFFGITVDNLVIIISNLNSSDNDIQFEQTKQTIISIREKIPNNYIFLIEGSRTSSEQNDYFKKNVDRYINYCAFDNVMENKIENKSLIYRELLLFAFKNFIITDQIHFGNLFIMEGTYMLDSNWNLQDYYHNFNVFLYCANYNFCNSYLYKLNGTSYIAFWEFVENNEEFFQKYNLETVLCAFNPHCEMTLRINKIDNDHGVSRKFTLLNPNKIEKNDIKEEFKRMFIC
jgi:hypothetical protein